MWCRASKMSWRAIAQNLGISPGTLWRFAMTDWEPKDNAIRLRLGLPPKLVLAPPCPNCGGAHDPKPCKVDKMTPANRAAVEQFITWARARDTVYLAQPKTGAVYDNRGHEVTARPPVTGERRK
jgi:hypothetical protein